MDKELDDILNNLQHCSETPPDLLTENLMLLIETDASLSEQLTALQLYEIQPSPQLFKTISTVTSTNTSKGLSSIKLFVRAAAVIVLLLVATWYVMQTQSEKEATQLNNQSADPAPSNPIYKDSMKDLEKITAVQKASPLIVNNQQYFPDIKPVGQNEIAVVNNDLLYTLMYCNYYVMKPYLPAEKNPLVLNIDQYSSVAVNGKMIRFMNVLYKKNNRLRSTWKARRAKNTLTKWKKKDSKYFDASADHQPMDIIHITEFIQNNR